MASQKFKFAIGDTVQDQITNFTGVVTMRTQWINGCNTYGVKSKELKDGKPLETEHFDEPQLILVEKKSIIPFLKRDKKTDKEIRTGGPISDKPKRPR